MQRRCLTPRSNKLQILPPEPVQSGQLEINEPVTDSDLDRGLNDYQQDSDSGGNDYESSSEESCNDYESPSEESGDNDYESDDRNYSYSDDFESESEFEDLSDQPVVIDLGNEITLHTTKDLEEALSCFTTIKWDVLDRNDHLFKTQFTRDLRFASDIFKVFLQQETKTLWRFQRKSEEHENFNNKCDFCLDERFKEKCLFKVPVFKNQLSADHSTVKSIFEFTAYIETGGHWETLEACYEEGFCKFSTCCLKSFCILSRPKRIQETVCQKGAKFHTGTDVIVHIPEGSVKSKENISFEVKQPEIINIGRPGEYWKPKILVAVSDRISMIDTKFRKPVYFSFPIPNVYSFRKPYEVRLIGFRGDKPYILDTKAQRIGSDYFYELKGFNGMFNHNSPSKQCQITNNCQYAVSETDALASLALVQSNENSVESRRQLCQEIDIFYGDKKACYILLLFQSKTEETINLITEVVFSNQLKERLSNYEQEGIKLIRKSPMLYLLPLLRIRIVVSGRLRLVTGRSGSHYFLTFIHASKNNKIGFPVKANSGGIPHAIIEFRADNFDRSLLYNTDFELYEFSKSRTPFYHR